MISRAILAVGSRAPTRSVKSAGLVFAAAVCGLSSAGSALGQMMMLPGQFDVSPTGAALYSVPVEVPPGTAGMSPALTLDYSSDGGNGLLGVGWNLGGLPSIGRCPKTVATDGVKGRVDFTLSDRFCMDGQRLIVVSGAYGATGSEYRTEIEGFTKVTAYGSAGNGPAYFIAQTKSGQIIEFGNSTDSRILAKGTTTARSWAANKITDTKGNYLTVTYTNDTTYGQAYPNRIDYTGNANASPAVATYNSVQFAYADRPDEIPQYVAGSEVRLTKRLTQVTTYAGATAVRVYKLKYAATSVSERRSKITSIELCDGGGTNCLPATDFTMTTTSLSFPTEVGSAIGVSSSVAIYFGDWNGDGVTDVMNWNPSTGANNWYVNNGSLSFTTYANKLPTGQVTGASSELRLGDWNGDAVTDIMWYDPSTGNNRWFINTVSGGAPSFPATPTTNPIASAQISSIGGSIQMGDWNGDAITDIMWWNTSGTNRWFVNNGSLGFTQTNNPVSMTRTYEIWNQNHTETMVHTQHADFVAFGDWNGDGITDAMRRFPPGEPGQLVNGSGPNTEACSWLKNDGALSFSSQSSSPCAASLAFGDWNGDGNLDLLLYAASSGTNIWYRNNGDITFGLLATNRIDPGSIANSNFILTVGDWNSDGNSDVMFHLPSTGDNRWFATSWSTTAALQFAYDDYPIAKAKLSGTGGAMGFGDWNGRAFDMPMFWIASSGVNRWWGNSAAIRPDLLTSVTTGLGSTSSFTFKPLTDDAVYTKYSSGDYPNLINFEVPIYVVSRVDADDGKNGSYSSSYSYEGARYDVQGRGFLGFRVQIATDLQTGIEQKLIFQQTFPYIGFVKDDIKTLGSIELSHRVNTYNYFTIGSPSTLRYFPYLESAVETSNDLDGTPYPAVTTNYTYDTYGNPLTITVSTPDGAVRTTTNTYDNNAGPWILGRLRTSTVTSTVP